MDADQPQPDPAPPSAAVRWAVRLGAAGAMALSAVLFWQSTRSGSALPGCGPDSGCEAVLSSRWSSVLGVPVAAPAVVVYATMLAASLHVGPGATPGRRRRAAWLLAATATMAVAAAVYFTGIQLVALGTLCRYCAATHAIGLVTGIVALTWAIPALDRRARGQAAALGVVPVALLVALQAATPPQTYEVVRGGSAAEAPAGASDAILLNQANPPLPTIRLDPREGPILGSPDAPVIVAELMDYTCPHCRAMHHQLTAAQARYADRLAVIPLHMPLDADCNPLVTDQSPRHETACELARLALAVWLAAPDRFAEYHDWLLDGEMPPTPEAAQRRAEELLGGDALEAALARPEIDARIERNVSLYALFRRSLPILLLPRSIVYGRPGTTEALFELLEAETALESPAPGVAPEGDAGDADAPAPPHENRDP